MVNYLAPICCFVKHLFHVFSLLPIRTSISQVFKALSILDFFNKRSWGRAVSMYKLSLVANAPVFGLANVQFISPQHFLQQQRQSLSPFWISDDSAFVFGYLLLRQSKSHSLLHHLAVVFCCSTDEEESVPFLFSRYEWRGQTLECW